MRYALKLVDKKIVVVNHKKDGSVFEGEPQIRFDDNFDLVLGCVKISRDVLKKLRRALEDFELSVLHAEHVQDGYTDKLEATQSQRSIALQDAADVADKMGEKFTEHAKWICEQIAKDIRKLDKTI